MFHILPATGVASHTWCGARFCFQGYPFGEIMAPTTHDTEFGYTESVVNDYSFSHTGDRMHGACPAAESVA